MADNDRLISIDTSKEPGQQLPAEVQAEINNLIAGGTDTTTAFPRVHATSHTMAATVAEPSQGQLRLDTDDPSQATVIAFHQLVVVNTYPIADWQWVYGAIVAGVDILIGPEGDAANPLGALPYRATGPSVSRVLSDNFLGFDVPVVALHTVTTPVAAGSLVLTSLRW